MSPAELQQKLSAKEDLVLIDVRDSYEYEDYHIDMAINIPMDEVLANLEKIDKSKPVVFYCKTGLRGQATIYMLQKMHHYTNLINLEGGVEAYQSLN